MENLERTIRDAFNTLGELFPEHSASYQNLRAARRRINAMIDRDEFTNPIAKERVLGLLWDGIDHLRERDGLDFVADELEEIAEELRDVAVVGG